MRVICVINLKGGVAKTVSAINIAHILTVKHGKRVLLIDNDKQGNTSKFFGLHSYDNPSISDVLTVKGYDIRDAIKALEWFLPFETGWQQFHVLPANMSLLRVNKEILMDTARPQQTRLKRALEVLREADLYDYVVIDNAPDLNMSDINALVAADDVLIPIKIDRFAFDGLTPLQEQIEEVREFNPKLRIAGGFITMYSRNNVNMKGEGDLRKNVRLPMFKTVIRKATKVDETTFLGIPLAAYAKNCTATKDYISLVEEYLQNVTETITNKGSGGNA